MHFFNSALVKNRLHKRWFLSLTTVKHMYVCSLYLTNTLIGFVGRESCEGVVVRRGALLVWFVFFFFLSLLFFS